MTTPQDTATVLGLELEKHDGEWTWDCTQCGGVGEQTRDGQYDIEPGDREIEACEYCDGSGLEIIDLSIEVDILEGLVELGKWEDE